MILRSYLDDVETDVLVEGVEDEFTQSVVAPGSMDQKQLIQEPELVHTNMNITCIYLKAIRPTIIRRCFFTDDHTVKFILPARWRNPRHTLPAGPPLH